MSAYSRIREFSFRDIVGDEVEEAGGIVEVLRVVSLAVRYSSQVGDSDPQSPLRRLAFDLNVLYEKAASLAEDDFIKGLNP